MLTKPRAISFHLNNDYKNLTNHLVTPQLPVQLVKPFLSLEVIKPGLELIQASKATDENEFLTSFDAGTATIIFLISGAADFSDSTRKNASFAENDVLWILAGSGISYSLKPKAQNCIGIKLRVALSPALQHAPAQSACLGSDLVECDGPARILLGQSGNAYSQWALPALINYLVITLKAGQTWTYEPPINHRIAWTSVINGKIKTSNLSVLADEIAVYENSNKPIRFFAEEDSIFLLGSSQEYTHDLILEKYPISGLHDASNKSDASASNKVFVCT